jgi:hypothetical protein
MVLESGGEGTLADRPAISVPFVGFPHTDIKLVKSAGTLPCPSS